MNNLSRNLKPENILNSLLKNVNNSNTSTILGYNKLVALRLLSFEKKLFRYYNAELAEFIDISYDRMIERLLN